MNKVILENTLRLLRKAKFEITGEEALVIHQVFSYWVSELKKLEASGKQVPEPPKSSISESQPQEEPVKEEKKSKKKGV